VDAAREVGEVDGRAMSQYPIRRRPPTWKRYVRYFVFFSIAGIGLIFRTGSFLYAAFPLVAWLIVVLRMRTTTCPECGDQLPVRKVKEEAGAERFVYDCPRCAVTWDSQYVRLPSAAD
jgi:hypothetical protein